jgi:hypothetical protein
MVLAAALVVLVVANPATANVGVTARSPSEARGRAIAVVAPKTVGPGNVLVAVVAARLSAHEVLRSPARWRLAYRTSSGHGRSALTQAVYVHVVRARDSRRAVFRTDRPTALVAKLLVLRGAHAKRTVGALASRVVAPHHRLTSPVLPAASPGDLLVVAFASTGPRLSLSLVTRTIHNASQLSSVAAKGVVGPGTTLVFSVRSKTSSRHSTPSRPSTPTDPSTPTKPSTKPTSPPSTPPPPPPPPPAGQLLVSDSFDRPDGLITNEFAFWDPGDSSSVVSPTWQLDSGSLFVLAGTGWTGVPDDTPPNATSSTGTDSAIFRLVTRRSDLGNVSVSFSLDNTGLSTTPSTPAVAWDGVHVFLRYQSETSLYYASINRRDGTSVIKKKVTGGPDNGGTYYDLTPYVSHPVPYGTWQSVTATVRTNADGSVTIRLLSGGQLVVEATDHGTGGPPITSPGRVGLRGDNSNFRFDNFQVSALPA